MAQNLELSPPKKLIRVILQEDSFIGLVFFFFLISKLHRFLYNENQVEGKGFQQVSLKEFLTYTNRVFLITELQR